MIYKMPAARRSRKTMEPITLPAIIGAFDSFLSGGPVGGLNKSIFSNRFNGWIYSYLVPVVWGGCSVLVFEGSGTIVMFFRSI